MGTLVYPDLGLNAAQYWGIDAIIAIHLSPSQANESRSMTPHQLSTSKKSIVWPIETKRRGSSSGEVMTVTPFDLPGPIRSIHPHRVTSPNKKIKINLFIIACHTYLSNRAYRLPLSILHHLFQSRDRAWFLLHSKYANIQRHSHSLKRQTILDNGKAPAWARHQ